MDRPFFPRVLAATACCTCLGGCGSGEPAPLPPPPAAVLAGGPGGEAVGLARPLGPDVPRREGDPPMLYVDYLSTTVEGRDVLWESVPVVPGGTVEVELTFRLLPNPEVQQFKGTCQEAWVHLDAWPSDGADPPGRADGYRNLYEDVKIPAVGGGRFRGTVPLKTDRAFNPTGYRVNAVASCAEGVADWTPVFDLVLAEP